MISRRKSQFELLLKAKTVEVVKTHGRIGFFITDTLQQILNSTSVIVSVSCVLTRIFPLLLLHMFCTLNQKLRKQMQVA